MKAPRHENRGDTSGQLPTTVTDQTGLCCPFACLGRHQTLFDAHGEPQATRCLDCDAALTRLAWLAELDRAADRS